MNKMKNTDFEWVQLVDLIKTKKIIPVIGQGVYWVRTQEGEEVLLYQYLAKQLAKEIGKCQPDSTNHAFSKIYYKCQVSDRFNYQELRDFIMEKISTVELAESSPLLKLAQIKPFSLFINTTYDNLLETAINTARTSHTEPLFSADEVTDSKINETKNSKNTLIVNIYGNLEESLTPAITENDIIEKVLDFKNQTDATSQNTLLKHIKEKSLLFIGCGYDDWLFRFFIRSIMDSFQPLNYKTDPIRRFIGDDFRTPNIPELATFLKPYNTHIYYDHICQSFVDKLFNSLQDDDNRNIIQKEEFPDTVFISFHGKNRPIVRQLVSHLKNDGIRVWMDEFKLQPGDPVAQTINSAINRCPVFIPIYSKKAKKFASRGDLRYHIHEWEWANSRYIMEKNQGINSKQRINILPVNIDDVDWHYPVFKDITDTKIPDGCQNTDGYQHLKTILLSIQNKKGG